MSGVGSFPPFVPAQGVVSRNDVEAYLTEFANLGFQVFSDSSGYVIEVQETMLLMVKPNGDLWTVGYSRMNVLSTLGDAATFEDLVHLIDKAGKSIGIDVTKPPSSARLIESRPAYNYHTISILLAGGTVEAIFDPYLQNASLAELTNILSFGSSTPANGIRLLGSPTKFGTQSTKLTRAGLDAWLREHSIAGDARITKAREHRRFMLVSGGRSLLLGHSLNAIHKNEALRVEPDNDDRSFFDSEWATATPIA